MKKLRRYKKWVVIINYIPMFLWFVFYKKGGIVSFYMIPLQILLGVINYFSVDKIRNILFMNANLLISTIVGIYINSQLYFKYIKYDIEGVMVRNLEILVGILFVSMIFIVSVLCKLFSNSRKKHIMKK